MKDKIAEILNKFTLMCINGRYVAEEAGNPTPEEREFIGQVCVIKTKLEKQMADEIQVRLKPIAKKYAKMSAMEILRAYNEIMK